MQSEIKPRAPAAQLKLKQAAAVLADLEQETAILSLEAFEGRSGAQKALDIHLAKIEAAQRQVSQLKAATELAERLDREAGASAAAVSLSEQAKVFRTDMEDREGDYIAALDLIGRAADRLVSYARKTLKAGGSVPSGCTVPVMMIGGQKQEHAFGFCEALLRAEIYRHLPTPRHGELPLRLPFAEHPRMGHTDPASIRPGAEEFHDANEAIIKSIEAQVSAICARQMQAASAPKAA
jgi:hypothetical protein